jgi:hypothetical protein
LLDLAKDAWTLEGDIDENVLTARSLLNSRIVGWRKTLPDASDDGKIYAMAVRENECRPVDIQRTWTL